MYCIFPGCKVFLLRNYIEELKLLNIPVRVCGGNGFGSINIVSMRGVKIFFKSFKIHLLFRIHQLIRLKDKGDEIVFLTDVENFPTS